MNCFVYAMTNTKPILITGGTGKTGRRVAQRLVDAGQQVRVGSRNGEPGFEWNNPDTWESVLADAQAVYLAYYPDLAFPGAAETVRAFAERGVAMGVERFVLLSGRGEPGAEISEAGVRAVAAHWTVLRSSFFSQNFSEHFLLDPVLAGVIALPAGNVGEPFIDADDLAEIAVAALTSDKHDQQVYELTGPRLLTLADAAEELSRATGRPITYHPVSAEEYVELAVSHGVPAEEAGPLAQLFSEVLDGRNAHVTTDVSRALGRPATDFRSYATATAATGIWNPKQAAR